MTLKSKKEVINEILETFFGRDDKILFYFLKKRKNQRMKSEKMKKIINVRPL
jgi:hypothetical protein